MAKQSYFITGTDTDAGKTFITAGLLQRASELGLSCFGLKPVAAGCEMSESGLRNSDALLLQKYSSIQLPYEQVNPVALEPPIAPHIAAQQLGKQLSADRLAGLCRGAMMRSADLVLIEGAGGWRVPLNTRETLADVAKQLNCKVILVVAMRLGCINHALLSAEAIRRDGLELVGWVANTVSPGMSCYAENLATLKQMLPAPLLGEVGFQEQPLAENISASLQLPSEL